MHRTQALFVLDIEHNPKFMKQTNNLHIPMITRKMYAAKAVWALGRLVDPMSYLLLHNLLHLLLTLPRLTRKIWNHAFTVGLHHLLQNYSHLHLCTFMYQILAVVAGVY